MATEALRRGMVPSGTRLTLHAKEFPMKKVYRILALAALTSFSILVVAIAQNKGPQDEQERKVKENEVPKAALDALKKLAAGAALKEFEEEIEHGHKFYEGTFQGEHGKVDALVTEAGAVVEIEEMIPSAMVPQDVLNAAKKSAGGNAELRFEKKTLIMYEVKFKKGDRWHEVTLTPDGRTHEHEEKKAQEGQEDD
jgi:hypothetical protein